MLVAVSSRNTMTTLTSPWSLLSRALENRILATWSAVLCNGRCLPPRGCLWNCKPHNAFQDRFRVLCPYLLIKPVWASPAGMHTGTTPLRDIWQYPTKVYVHYLSTQQSHA